MTHKQAQRVHSINRARQRYGLKLKKYDIDNIIILIQNRKAISVKKLTNSRTLHIVQYADRELKVIYDKNLHNICTFMPIDWNRA